MGLEDLNSIDSISQADNPDNIRLGIHDWGGTPDPEQRHALLVAKLKGYFGEIVGGGLKDKYPNSGVEDFEIVVFSSCRPTPQMLTITELYSPSQPDAKVPVRFEEYPVGAWEETDKNLATPAPRAPGAQVEAGPDLPAEAGISGAALQAIRDGLLLSELKFMSGTSGFTFIMVGSDQGSDPVDIAPDQEPDDETLIRARNYIISLPPEFPIAVLFTGVCEGKRVKNALLIFAFERGREHGIACQMPVSKGLISRKYSLQKAQLQVIGPVPSWFVAENFPATDSGL